MTIGGQGDQDASSLMAALGGALVYYHKPQKSDDNWREPPSFWNPFWRAKLHPIIKEEADQALADHGASLTNYDGLGKPQFD
jgi:hypothetical protein